jgi:ZIP family zinc transporter
MTRSVMITTTVLLALAVAVGAGVGVTLPAELTGFALATVLSLGAAALLYLVIEELIVEADQGPEPLFATAMFFVGFLLFIVVSNAHS